MKYGVALGILSVSILLCFVLVNLSDSGSHLVVPPQSQNDKHLQAQSVTSSTQMPRQQSDGNTFGVSHLYWASPRPLLMEEWDMVFAGTVVEVKSEKENMSGDFVRHFKTGKIKVARVFLDSATGKRIAIGDYFEGEGFDGSKRGDKVIVFINASYYEESLARTDVEGTNSKLGFKIKNWDDPIVTAVEKVTRCTKIVDKWVEGHRQDFRAKVYDCKSERDKMLLEDKELADVWRRYDPQGIELLHDIQQNIGERKR